MMTTLKDVELAVYECPGCGFHLGLDVTYLDQQGDLDVPCPNPTCDFTFITSRDNELI